MGIILRRGNCNFDGVLQDEWGSTETAPGIPNCGYGCTMGTGIGVLRIRIRAYVRAKTLTLL